MATFDKRENGELDDRVRVVLKGNDVRIFENYEVEVAVLTQPAAFTTTLSARDGAAALLKKYPPNTPFQLLIGSVPQFSGFTDSRIGQGPAGSTSTHFRGRDVLSRFSGDVEADMSFTNVTPADLVRKAMAENGLSNLLLQVDNEKNRRIRSGVKVAVVAEPRFGTEIIRSSTAIGEKHVVHAKLGECWLDFINRHLARQALFLWADFEGNLVVSAPNPKQRPTFWWTRQRGVTAGRVNVIDAEFHDDTTHRFSEVVIYTRGTGKKAGYGKQHGDFVDSEMLSYGFNRKKVYRDVNVSTIEQARTYARRKIAEANRHSWRLRYVFAGHTAPAIVGDRVGGRAVITPDLVAKVDDDEYGIHENLYIESVKYTSPPQRTIVTMMRLKDLVFGSDD